MKITIVDIPPDEEEEIIVRCSRLDEDVIKLLHYLKEGNSKLHLYKGGKIHLISPEDIYYFESVDQKVFAYCGKDVFETKSRLYELEERLPTGDFFRASKAMVLNLNKIQSLAPAFDGRFEALLKNGERVIISRQYVAVLKERLGL